MQGHCYRREMHVVLFLWMKKYTVMIGLASGTRTNGEKRVVWTRQAFCNDNGMSWVLMSADWRSFLVWKRALSYITSYNTSPFLHDLYNTTVNKCGMKLKFWFMLWFTVFLLIAEKSLTEQLLILDFRLFSCVCSLVCTDAKTDCKLRHALLKWNKIYTSSNTAYILLIK